MVAQAGAIKETLLSAMGLTRQGRPVHAGHDSLRQLLVGGDCRSIARSNEALALLRADPARIADLISLVDDSDWLVVMRAVDLTEKLAHEHPEWIQPHRKLLIGPLADHPSWEIRLQIARAAPAAMDACRAWSCRVHPARLREATAEVREGLECGQLVAVRRG